MSNSSTQVVPVLRIFDFAKAKEFYIDWLGFTIDWEYRFGENFPLYMQVSKQDNIVLHLTEHHGDCSPGAKVFIRIQGIEALQQELAAKDYGHYKPGIELAPWNAKTMELIDPFGNKLFFNEALPDEIS
jgi:uncharacterized glyoxalase superfamily protein PhnB